MIVFPAEWMPQSGVMLTFPHLNTDWKPILEEVIPCFVKILNFIIKKEKLLLVCHSIKEIKSVLKNVDDKYVIFREFPSNDSWARDYAPIGIFINGTPCLLDFVFNGWGLKFPANYDNQISRCLYESASFAPSVKYKRLRIILEAGSIESDGEGTLLTTTRCLLSRNRNDGMDIFEWENVLSKWLGIQRILWLHHGFLLGDDTDSHIDTLARFCDRETIAYVQCTDQKDDHFAELFLMEKELKSFKTLKGNPYRLIPLPMAKPVYDHQGKRLPATYANFLILNDMLLMPIYQSSSDEEARISLQKAFPEREIVGVNCLPLIKQYGSLHCCTMQFPQGFL